MESKEKDRLLEHDYDGIQEYDNPMPRWWLWVFYATIFFVPLYYILPSPFGEGEGVLAQYEAEVAAHAAMTPPPVVASAENLDALVQRPELIAAGKAVFEQSCAACHRLDAGGLIGPNLTDDAWIHGDAPAAIRKTISEGVLAKGMPPWDRALRPEQIDAVTAYVISLRGTNPPNPKAPEGAVVPRP